MPTADGRCTMRRRRIHPIFCDQIRTKADGIRTKTDKIAKTHVSSPSIIRRRDCPKDDGGQQNLQPALKKTFVQQLIAPNLGISCTECVFYFISWYNGSRIYCFKNLSIIFMLRLCKFYLSPSFEQSRRNPQLLISCLRFLVRVLNTSSTTARHCCHQIATTNHRTAVVWSSVTPACSFV